MALHLETQGFISGLFKFIRQALIRVYGSIEKNAQYSEPRFLWVGAIATIGFPLYYILWKDIFPQPYENLELRLIGSLIFMPLIFTRYWPKKIRKWLAAYWDCAILYALPFFFTFMFLKNPESIVWLMSALISIFIMVLLLDGLSLFIQFVIGVGLATFAFYVTEGGINISVIPLEYLPVYIFAIVLASAANFTSERVNQEKLNAILAAASNIAHELRTPLLGIKSGAMGLNQYLPTLLESYLLAKQHQLMVPHIRQVHLENLQQIVGNISSEVDYSNKIIDMLLMNAQSLSFDRDYFQVLSMSESVRSALQRYPFTSDDERHLVVCHFTTDFTYRGSELLMIHVLFNLLKNALYHITKAHKGKIYIDLISSEQENSLIFKDTGSGIPSEIVPQLFTRFFSWAENGTNTIGSGLGLSFCKTVIESFGGTICCQSEYGMYTTFRVTLPKEKKL